MNEIQRLAKENEQKQIDIRRQIHSHPELGTEEVATSALIVKELEGMGVEVRRGYAKTGVVGLIHGKGPGKTIMIRADMDALPMQELGDCAYRSQAEGITHACGHDAHTSAVLGAARILSAMRDQFDGTVKLCFQPAEEAPTGGADQMVADGVLEDPHVDFSIGMHVTPSMPVGYVSVEAGPITSYPDFFSFIFKGKGGHGSFPSKSNDPIRPMVEAYNMIQGITKRVSPLEPCVVQVCTLSAGTAEAVIPDTAKVMGTVRTLHKHNREIVKTELENIVKHVAEIYHVEYEFHYRGKCSPVYNDPAFVPKVQESVKDIFEKGFFTDEVMKIGGEDYCFISEHVPSVFFLVGSSDGTPRTQYPVHNPYFDLDESVIAKGSAAFAQIAVDYLNGRYDA